MEEIRDLSRWIDFNNLTYRYKGESTSKNLVDFKDRLAFYKNMEEGHTTRKRRRKTKTY